MKAGKAIAVFIMSLSLGSAVAHAAAWRITFPGQCQAYVATSTAISGNGYADAAPIGFTVNVKQTATGGGAILSSGSGTSTHAILQDTWSGSCPKPAGDWPNNTVLEFEVVPAIGTGATQVIKIGAPPT